MRILRAQKALVILSDRISAAFNEIYECNEDLRGYKGQIVELAGLRPTEFFEIDELRADAFRWGGETGKNKFPHLRLYARPIFKGGRRGAIQDIDDIFNIRFISMTEWNQKKQFRAKPKPKEKELDRYAKQELGEPHFLTSEAGTDLPDRQGGQFGAPSSSQFETDLTDDEDCKASQ